MDKLIREGSPDMKVVYAPGLEALAQSLGRMGFEMHPMGDNVAADAVLCEGSLRPALNTRSAAGGALLLNVRGLSPAQTAQALRRRCQLPLF